MGRRLLFIFIALGVFLMVAYYVSLPTQKSPTTQPPAKTAQTPATAPDTPQPEPAKSEKTKAWPYLTGEYKVAIADNLLARNIVLIFDGSGSMSKSGCSGALTKIQAAKKAVSEWSGTVPSGANLGLVCFHGKSRNLLIREMESGNRDKFIGTIQSIVAGGKTPLTPAFKEAFMMLEKQAQKQLGYGEYTIVVVTDGIANSPEDLTRAVNWILQYTPIDIYTIGFCISGDHSLNQKGRTFYRAANNPEQLRQGLKDVLAEAEEFDITEFK
jgi:Ca-activated chloride channel family protein